MLANSRGTSYISPMSDLPRQMPPSPGATRGRHARAALSCALAGLTALGGCYRYTPMSDAPGTGSDVRIHLTPSGTTSLAPVLGAGTTSISGRIISAADSGVVIAVSETSGPRGRVPWAGEHIALPRDVLGSAERRSMDRRRTVKVVAVGVGAAAVMALLVNSIASRAGGDDDGTVVIPPEPAS